jgi:hypothetical protein
MCGLVVSPRFLEQGGVGSSARCAGAEGPQYSSWESNAWALGVGPTGHGAEAGQENQPGRVRVSAQKVNPW